LGKASSSSLVQAPLACGALVIEQLASGYTTCARARRGGALSSWITHVPESKL
jgi:hypothetical protein